jgi:hypothetical protein
MPADVLAHLAGHRAVARLHRQTVEVAAGALELWPGPEAFPAELGPVAWHPFQRWPERGGRAPGRLVAGARHQVPALRAGLRQPRRRRDAGLRGRDRRGRRRDGRGRLRHLRPGVTVFEAAPEARGEVPCRRSLCARLE